MFSVLLVAELDPRELFLVLDLGHERVVAGLHHAVGEAIDGLHLRRQSAAADSAESGSFSTRASASFSISADQG